tara:strand:- start:43304 stop:43783 length:480 start_codon:yes stop_codon:yes gene_type:complete
VAPLAIAIAPSELVAIVEQNARATHDAPLAVSGAVFQALLIRECLDGPAGLLEDSLAFDAAVARATEKSGFPLATKTVASPSGHVAECLPAVVAALRIHGTDFSAAMLTAKWIVHADAIDLSWRACERSVRGATRSALREVSEQFLHRFTRIELVRYGS